MYASHSIMACSAAALLRRADRVDRRGYGAGPAAVLRAIALGDAEQLADDDRRQRIAELGRPAQWRLRVTACDRIDELLKRRPHFWMCDLVRSVAGTAPNLDHVITPRARTRLVASLPHRADRHASCARNRGYAVADRISLGSSPQSTRPLIHGRLQQRHFSRTDFSASTGNVDHVGEILSIPLDRFQARLDRLAHSWARGARERGRKGGIGLVRRQPFRTVGVT
jgi:hypothetical protein